MQRGTLADGTLNLLGDHQWAFAGVRESFADDLDLSRVFHPPICQRRRFPEKG